MLVQDVNRNKEIINAKNLSKEYQYYEKEEGIKGSVKNLFWRKYLTKKAVDNINISIKSGEIVGLIGLNGAGKTTTLKMMSGLIKQTSGQIEVLGYKPFDKKREFLRQISMVMGNKSQLWWDLPAIESFELNQKIYSVPFSKYKANLREMIDLLQIEKLVHTQVRRLSLGERMKMEIVAALIHEPKIIFLDEPTIGLDIISQYKIRVFLKRYNKMHDSTVILTSDNFDDIISLCDTLIILNEGKIIFYDKFEEFQKRFSAEKIITLRTKNNRGLLKEVEKIEGLQNMKYEQNAMEFYIKDNETAELLQILEKFDLSYIDDIQIQNLSMDEIVRRIYQK